MPRLNSINFEKFFNYDLIIHMSNKGFEANVILQETPNFEATAEKPLKQEKTRPKKVDINVLKARAKSIQDKENLKNTIVLVSFLIVLGIVGIYFSI